MKKLFAFMLCAVLLCAVPISAFAEGEISDSVEAEGSVAEELIAGEETSVEVEEKDEMRAITDNIMSYIEEHIDSISLILTVLLSIFYQIRKHALLNKSIGTLNNNAVTVAENSATCIQEALLGMTGVANTVAEYREKTTELLEAYKQSAEDKKALEAMLVECEKYLKNAKSANVELSNEVAELLVLANIPNSKKDELYARHRAAVGLIEKAEATEVTPDERKEE